MGISESDVFALLDQINAAADASFVAGVIAGILITVFVYTYIGKLIMKILGLGVAAILTMTAFNYIAPELLREKLSPTLESLFQLDDSEES